MWTGTTKLHAWKRLLPLFLILGVLPSFGLAAEVALIWVDTPGRTKFATWDESESRSNLAKTVSAIFHRGFEIEQVSFYGLEKNEDAIQSLNYDPSKPKNRTPDLLSILAEKLNIQFLLTLQILKFEQRNISSRAMLNNLGKPESDTKVAVRYELFDAKTKGIIASSESKLLEFTFKGPFFGTTNKSEMSGSPDDKRVMIENENRKRMEAIARATWWAIKDPLLNHLKL